MNGTQKLSQPKLVIQSSVAETGRLHAWLDEALARRSVPDRLGNAVRLCLEEAVMNVIAHGYGEGAHGEVEISLSHHEGGLCAMVADRAPAFDPVGAPAPPVHRASLQEGPLGGRGLRLMRRFASRLHYERKDGKNQLTLCFED